MRFPRHLTLTTPSPLPRLHSNLSPPPAALLLTCEHGGNLIPRKLSRHFKNRSRLLHSHRGWDPGALDLATHLATTLHAPLLAALVSRLVVDLNRSRDNPTLFSTITSKLGAGEQDRIIQKYYTPYRDHIAAEVLRHTSSAKPVLHLSVHSFTPVLRGQRRTTDIGLLFDPSRTLESRIARTLQALLKLRLPALTIDLNKPYLGTDDGLTTTLRTRTNAKFYAGIELEVNQRFFRAAGSRWIATKSAIADALFVAARSADHRGVAAK